LAILPKLRQRSSATKVVDIHRPGHSAAIRREAMRHLSQRDNDEERKEPLLKELRRQENQSTPPADQIARDALFDEFLRWQVHQVLGE